MSTKHTPGPWFYSGKHDTCEVRYVAISPDNHYEEIATLFGKDGAEQEANAHLISAAPIGDRLVSDVYGYVQRQSPCRDRQSNRRAGMNIRQVEAVLEALEMARDALTVPVSDKERETTKVVLTFRIAQLQSDLRMAQREQAA